MARDPERINRILKRVKEIWEKNPDLRLCQLIGNCFDSNIDPYFTEDEKIEELLNKFYK